MFKIFSAVHLVTYYLACLFLGHYNIHLVIAGKKILDHNYENHIEHLAIYYGLIMTLLVGGGYLINILFWIYSNEKFKPFFLKASIEV